MKEDGRAEEEWFIQHGQKQERIFRCKLSECMDAWLYDCRKKLRSKILKG